MAYRRLLKPRFLVSIPLLLVLIIAVACGEDATSTPRPTATSAPTTAPPPATAAMEPTATPTKPAATATPAPTPKPGDPTHTPAPPTSTPKPTATKAAVRPTLTPTPTALPPAPTPTPGFGTSSVNQLLVATAPPVRESMLPWENPCVMLLVRPFYENLVGIDPVSASYIGELAKSWEMRPDGLQWTLELQDAPFHFSWGEFTSTDVRHSWEQTVQEAGVGCDATNWRASTNTAEDIDISDPRKVVWNMAKVWPNLDFELTNIGGTIMMTSKAQWDAVGLDGMRKQPAGTGPFRYVEQVVKSHVLYERVENHWRRTPDFKELLIRIVLEDSTRLAMLLTDEAHIADLPKDLQDTAIAGGMSRTAATNFGTAWYLNFGGNYFGTPEDLKENVAFNNVKVREALNRSIDRDAIIDSFFFGRAEKAAQVWYNPATPGWDPKWADDFEANYGYDPDKAKALLAEAGYPDGFEMTLWDYPYGGFPELNLITEAVSDYFRAVGVDVNYRTVDYPIIRQEYRAHNIHDQMLGFPTYGFYQPYTITYMVNHSSSFFADFTDPRIDAAFDALDQTAVRDERDVLLNEIGDILYYEYAYVPMVWTPIELIYNPNVIADYTIPGILSDPLTHLEYITAAK